MNLMFGIAMFSFALLGLVSFIGLIWSSYRKHQKKPWLIFIAINAFLFVGSVALYNHLLTPEEKSAFAVQREQRKAEQEREKNSERINASMYPKNQVERSDISSLPEKNTALETNSAERKDIAKQNPNHTAPESQSAESVFTSIAHNKLGRNFKRLEVRNSIDDSSKKIVLVHYDGRAGWDNTMTKKSILIQTADLFKDLFASGIAIQEITAFIYADMIGPNGSNKGLAMKCQLKGSTAANINWESIDKAKFNQNLDYVWMTPDIRTK